jgi:hypothetical protein
MGEVAPITGRSYTGHLQAHRGHGQRGAAPTESEGEGRGALRWDSNLGEEGAPELGVLLLGARELVADEPHWEEPDAVGRCSNGLRQGRHEEGREGARGRKTTNCWMGD